MTSPSRRTNGYALPALSASGATEFVRESGRALDRSCTSLANRRVTRLSDEIAQGRTLDAQLLLLTVATGILDATTFKSYRVFTTKQTGNTLFLAMYALDRTVLSHQIEKNVAASIFAFIAGGIFFGYLGRRQLRTREWLLWTNFLQTVLVLLATKVRYWTPDRNVGLPALVIVALLAFASSGQITMAVGLGMSKMNTTMITGNLIDFASDPRVFGRRNALRARRVLFYLSLLVGCFVGAMLYTPDAWIGLLLAAIIKAIVGLSFIWNPAVEDVDGETS